MTAAHRRYNPLLDEWVLCSPGRLHRPWRGASEKPSVAVAPPYDPDCYLCPGNARAGGARNPDYKGVFLFDNDFPALGPEPSSGGAEPEPHPLFVSRPERGRCRVISFSERHDRHLGALDGGALRALVDAWASESEGLLREGAAYVQVFENRGEMMGASNPHPHGQIWAVEHLPSIPARKTERLEAYWSEQGTDLLGDYLEEEIRRQERVVEGNDHWVHLVPFWAVWPFETLLLPRRPAASLGDLTGEERSGLAAILRSLVRRYDGLFGVPFAYSMGWYQRPKGRHSEGGFRLHATYLPPLVRSASIRKFLVGYELTAEPQRDFTPEEAAERLRAVPASGP